MTFTGRGIYQLNEILSLSRAIGDAADKPYITAEPDMMILPMEGEDEFIILATDGLWDVFTSDDAVAFVQTIIREGLSRDQVATRMVEKSFHRRSLDNVTVVIIWLDTPKASASSE